MDEHKHRAAAGYAEDKVIYPPLSEQVDTAKSKK
jgi:hypothetical protein